MRPMRPLRRQRMARRRAGAPPPARALPSMIAAAAASEPLGTENTTSGCGSSSSDGSSPRSRAVMRPTGTQSSPSGSSAGSSASRSRCSSRASSCAISSASASMISRTRHQRSAATASPRRTARIIRAWATKASSWNSMRSMSPSTRAARPTPSSSASSMAGGVHGRSTRRHFCAAARLYRAERPTPCRRQHCAADRPST